MDKSSAVKPVIAYVGDIAPIDRAASEVVMYRHLRALEREGYSICVITIDRAGLNEQLPARWDRVLLPTRRTLYPPYRPYEPLQTIRWLLNDQLVQNYMKSMSVQAVIGLLMGEYLVCYAEWLARKMELPLFYFYHDRGETLHYGNSKRRAARLRRQNLRLLNSPVVKRVWTASPELKYSEPAYADKFSVVYPLPQATSARTHGWRSTWADAPVLAHIGTIYNEAIASFRVVLRGLQVAGGRLLVFSQYASTAETLAAEFPSVVHFAGFEPNSAAMLVAVARDATGFLVVSPDPVATMPWSLDCFPSKFSQLVQIGLPGAIFAPAETSIGRWCKTHSWSLYRHEIDFSSVCSVLAAISTRDGWNAAASQSLKAASGIFEPARIEKLVSDDLHNWLPMNGRGSQKLPKRWRGHVQKSC